MVRNLQSVWRCAYCVWHRQSDGEVASRHSPIHGTHPNSGGAERTVAITPRFVSAPKQSRDMTLGEGVALPRCLGTDTVIPWQRTSTVGYLNRSRLVMGAVTIALHCAVSGVWSTSPHCGWSECDNDAETMQVQCGRWVYPSQHGCRWHAARLHGHDFGVSVHHRVGRIRLPTPERVGMCVP
jgi:hypothetical protein